MRFARQTALSFECSHCAPDMLTYCSYYHRYCLKLSAQQCCGLLKLPAVTAISNRHR